MHTVLVANTKGGCGKTTVATHLAAAFANAGLPTALADVDRQRSSLAWLGSRPVGSAPIQSLDWVKDITEPPSGAARIVVDVPAAMKIKQLEDLIRLADIVVLPVLPSGFDEAATARFLDKLEALKPIRNNRMRARSRAADHLGHFMRGLEQSVVARVRDSVVYADLSGEGRSVFDLNGRRYEDLRGDWHPLLVHLERQF
jgi:chromosome partitioning protein